MQSALMPRHWPHLVLGTTALIVLTVAANAARGQENTSTSILVTASVEAACSLQTDQIALDFGVYNDTQIDKTASFTYNCPAGKDVSFDLVGGGLPDGSGIRPLPNIDAGGTPLDYQINHPGGTAWVSSFNIPSSPGGDDIQQFSAILFGGQLATVSPGQFSDTIQLQMTVNN